MMDESRGKFGPGEDIETPFMRARQVWDDRIGSAKQQAYVWRTIGLIALAMTVVMGLALIWRSTTADVQPYVVEVDSSGEVRMVGTPQTQNWEPGDGVQQFFLRQWITDVRTISSDETVVRENLLRAYNGVSSRAGAILDDHVAEENPFDLSDELTRAVEITNVNAVGEEKSWRVEWSESVRDPEGYLMEEREWVGIFELERIPPETASDVEENALGLFVEHFSWSETEK